jgi:hypothetical protein
MNREQPFKNGCITKQELEKILGYEITRYNVEVVNNPDGIPGISIQVQPKQKIENIEISMTILPSNKQNNHE